MNQEKEDQLWKEIEALGWTADHDYRRIAIQLVTSGRRNALHAFYRTKSKELYALLHEVWDGYSDDGFDDLIAHIIGSGKATFDRIVANPKECNSIKAKESFAYCFNLDDRDLRPMTYLSRLVDLYLTNIPTAADYCIAASAVVGACHVVCYNPSPENLQKLSGYAQFSKDLDNKYPHHSGWLLSNTVSDLLRYAPHFPKQ